MGDRKQLVEGFFLSQVLRSPFQWCHRRKPSSWGAFPATWNTSHGFVEGKACLVLGKWSSLKGTSFHPLPDTVKVYDLSCFAKSDCWGRRPIPVEVPLKGCSGPVVLVPKLKTSSPPKDEHASNVTNMRSTVQCRAETQQEHNCFIRKHCTVLLSSCVL